MKKSVIASFVVCLGIGSLCMHGCGEAAPKPEESMESTFTKAKKDNPNAVPPEGKVGKVKADDSKMPAAENNAAP